VAEDDDLEVIRQGRPEPSEEQLQDALERDVNNGQNHGTSDDATRGPLFYVDRINAPHTIEVRLDGAQTRYDVTDMTNSPDNAGVRVPPPLLYALAVLGGYALNRHWPLAIGTGGAINVLALTFALAGVALSVSSVSNFRRSRTSILPIRPATALVISGPYRFTRNPMYVALAAMTIAAGLLVNSWWVMLLLVLVLPIVQVFVIGPEERYLERRFGADYVAYTHQVRRWV